MGHKKLRIIDAPFYNSWQALYLAFYSSKLYVDVGKRWRGLGIKYLLLLSCVITIPFVIRIVVDFNYFFNEQLLKPIEDLPVFYVQKGNVFFAKPMPYIGKNNAGEVIYIIDTTGKITDLDTKKFPYLSILVTKNQIFYRLLDPHLYFVKHFTQSEKIYREELSENINQAFNGKIWLNLSQIKLLKYFFQFSIYLCVVVVLFTFFLMLFLSFAMMGQLIAKLFFKFSLTYKQASRLLIVSSTPELTLFFIFLTLNKNYPWLGIFYLLTLGCYFSYALMSLKRATNKLVIS